MRSVGHSARALQADDALASLHHSYGAARCDVSIIRCCFVLLKIAECRHQQLCSDVIITGHINQSVYPPSPNCQPSLSPQSHLNIYSGTQHDSTSMVQVGASCGEISQIFSWTWAWAHRVVMATLGLLDGVNQLLIVYV